VAIVGAGFTGLWTAYYLSLLDPGLRIAVVEREIAGFGASGRNGGWCSALFPASLARVARLYSRDAAHALHTELRHSVDEVGRAAAAEGLDVHFAKGGTLTLATGPAQLARLRDEVAAEDPWAAHEPSRWLSADEAAERLRSPGVLGAVLDPDCAALHPGRLVRGLARVVERRGVRLYEHTPVRTIRRGVLDTPRGRLRAGIVVRATEAFTSELPGQRRLLAPIYSLVIATEPLPAAFWDAVGWRGRETVTDGRRLLVYAQRTADDRIVFGGRGAPYHAGSRIKPGYDQDPAVFAALERALHALLPGTADARITHRWGGPLGVSRDWFPSVGLDRATGLAWAGGYVGDGVATANLAGRTLADLITGQDTALTRLPWVGHQWRRWEPEPLRWLGINAARAAMASADAVEARTGRPAARGAVLARLLGD
jgi:glycine/D-amino acid oxidase-like deaminating enzyme